MEALILTVFASVVLSALGVVMFVWDVRQGSHDQHDRLALLPLEDSDRPTSINPATTHAESNVCAREDHGDQQEAARDHKGQQA